MYSWINVQIDSWLQPQLYPPSVLESLPSNVFLPKISDLLLPSIAVATSLVVIRHFFDKFVITPIGAYFDVEGKHTQQNATSFRLLENEYANCKRPTKDIVTILSKKTGLTERQVSVWFHKRYKQEKTSDLKKLQDASWHFIFYIVMSWYGIYVLWDKPWFEKAGHCWTGWPLQSVSSDLYWYYLVEFGFYLSGVYMLFTDHKRKDFTELIIHHIVTLFLMLTSYTYNLVRIGTLVLCVHDPVDYLLAMAKISIYLKKQKVADVFFVVFVLVWIATRLCIYPLVILHSVFIELPKTIADQPDHPDYPIAKQTNGSLIMYFVKASLLILQILHFIWTFLIIKSASAKFTKGEIEDARSDNEESDDEFEHGIENNSKSEFEYLESLVKNNITTQNGYVTQDDVKNLSLQSH